VVTLTSVLIVDDEPAVRDLIARWVSSLGLESTTAANSEEALERLRARHHDLAVIDVMMPGNNGLWLAGELRRDHPGTAVVIATAHSEMVEDVLTADVLIKPFKRERFVQAVDRGRRWRQRTLADGEWLARLDQEVQDSIADVRALIHERRERGHTDERILVELATERRPDVLAHSERVARYGISIAHDIGLQSVVIPFVGRAARFHDIGKIVIPEALLTKPSPMAPGEIAVMRRHVDLGAELLEATTMRELAPIVRSSHEWFDGTGYPARLGGSRIPLLSRIIAVADAYDAMTQSRAYCRSLGISDAVDELHRCSRSQFDPDIVASFLKVLGRH
jgi:response regulator RpfG family c-di-GMP phosphodiesterase